MKTKTKVESRQDLLYLLAHVAELEHSLACQYLFAAFSLKRAGEDGITDAQAEVVAGWRQALVEVAVQEMLHLGLASNLLTAIGGAPYLDRAKFPQPRTYTTLGLDFRLAPVSSAALRRFACFELPPQLADNSIYRKWPVGPDIIDWTQYCADPEAGRRLKKTLDETPLLPGPFAYKSIGEAYTLIREGFQSLYPGDEQSLFIGPPWAQTIGMWKQFTAVTDRKSADAAIVTILAQGEGAYGNDAEIAEAHFGRFVQVFTDLVGGLGGASPARDVVESPVLTLHTDISMTVARLDGGEEHVRPTLLTDDLARDANEIFVSIYEVSLLVLHRYLASDGESAEQQYILKQLFLSLMRFCVTPLGTAITTLPAFEGRPDGPRAGPSFEIYTGVSLLPQLESAWKIFEERLQQIANSCDALAKDGRTKPFRLFQETLEGVPNAPATPGVSNVLRLYATLVRTGLHPPKRWTWDNGIRAFFSPLDVFRMGTWIASEDAVRKNVVQILERVTGAGGSVTMPPDYLLGDEDAPAAYRNPEGRWTSERVQAFIQWAADRGSPSFDCPDQPTWHGTIRGMFTARDISCMLTMRGLNLGRYEQVKAQGEVIYRVVKTGYMPPGQPWAPNQIACFRKWLDIGCPEGERQPIPFHWARTSAPDASSRYDDIWFIDDKTGWTVNSNGHILHTTDGGESWDRQFQTPMVNGRPIYLRSVAFATSQRGWAGTLSAEQVLFDTEDGGKNWRAVQNLPYDAPVKVCGISVVDEKTVWCSGTNEPEDPARVMKTTDGGVTWLVFDMSAHATLLVDVYFFDAERGMVVGGLDRTWKEDPSRADVQPVILYTEDGGATWRDRLAPTVDEYPRGEWGWKIHWVNDAVGYVSLENVSAGAIAKTVDGGQTWVRLAINDSQTNANLEGVGFIDENRGWVGGWGDDTFTGGFTSVTNDGGESWVNANEVGAFINRFRFFGDPVHTGYASGRAVYKLTAGQAPKSNPPSLPTAKMLATTQPASFDGPISIGITIPEGAGHAALHVWNQFGRLVRTLVNDEKPVPGFRHLQWDGDNDGGEELPGGVYIYRLTVDDDAESRVVRLRRPGAW